MKNTTIWRSKYFFGNEISEYGLKNNRVDYRTLAKAFDAVLANGIIEKTYEIGFWEQENGSIDNSDEIDELRKELEELEAGKIYTENGVYFVDDDGEEITGDKAEEIDNRITEINEQIEELENEQDYPPEIFQYYIIDGAGAEILEDYTNEIVFYNEELDLYVWGVTHFGTSWDYVLTDIEINLNKEE